MSLAVLLKDIIYINKENGSSLRGPYKASVSTNLTAIVMADIDILEGDTLIRYVRDRKERYRVLHANWYPKSESLPAFWNLKLVKEIPVWAFPNEQRNRLIA